MAAVPAAPPRHARTDAVDIVLLVAGLAQLLPGLMAFLAPGAFYDQIAAYPPENAHFIKDLGSWQIALGAAALVAVRRPAWRAPMLGLLALQVGLHAISHVIDVDRAEQAWQGVSAIVLQAVGFLVLAALFVRERGRR